METGTIFDRSRTITLGEVCEALTAGSLPSRLEGENYAITRRDLARLVDSSRLEHTLALLSRPNPEQLVAAS